MDAFSGNRRTRGGFTLIEMLTVVTIIGVLAALVAGAAVMAQTYVKRVRIKLEVSAMDMAIKSLKEKYGDYPPDFTNDTVVKDYLCKMFPRCDRNKLDLAAAGVKTNGSAKAAAALVFWLGGVNGTGFNQDPIEPLKTGGNRILPFFDFDTSRVQQIDGSYVYLPPGSGDSDPYCYFKTIPGSCTFTHTGEVPATTTANTQANTNISTFQILSPGLGGRFGVDDIGNFQEVTP